MVRLENKKFFSKIIDKINFHIKYVEYNMILFDINDVLITTDGWLEFKFS